MSLSLCMIVKDEEKNLGRCLESIKDIVDEIIIVDTGSTDNTIKIAEKYGAKIFHYKWDNSFANARNYSLSKASKDWILIMDADDEFVAEDKDNLLALINNTSIKLNAFLGETLSYLGASPNHDIYSNLNIRLIRNRKGYKFKGDIHEQIVPGIEDKNKAPFLGIADIRFYHYGYLTKTVKEKNKRKRNMKIIEKLLKENPNNNFMLYNMGVEYSAKGDYIKALSYLEKAYKNFNPSAGFSPKLILKIISCNEALQRYDECLKVIEEGLNHYPNFTDLEFHKANILFIQNKYSSAIESAKKCISIGEAPVHLREILGVGSYRSYFLLGDIYCTIGDLNGAYECYEKVLELNPKFNNAFFKITDIMASKNFDATKIQRKLESYVDNFDEETTLLFSKIFYNLNNFNLAYEYAKKAETLNKNSQKARFYKGIYLFYQGNYKEALEKLYSIKNEEYYNPSIYCIILCELFTKNYEKAESILKITEDFNEPEETKVYKTLIDIIKKDKYIKLAENEEESQKFIKPIFNLLEILLKANCFNQFEKAVNLLNLIKDNKIFMLLGKLYYKYGYFSFAYEEFIRSIKTYEIIDAESLSMMKVILLSK